MTKIAIFVEGHTEEALVEAIIVAVAGINSISIEVKRQSKNQFTTVKIQGVNPASSKFVLIMNCCNDDAVLSQMRDQYASLSHAGYSRIIGLRDVYPTPPVSTIQLTTSTAKFLPKGAVQASMHFAVREVESWFIQEVTHFQRIDRNLTRALISSKGFDPFDPNSNAETILHPAGHLNSIYKLVKKSYKKSAKHRARTIDALSLEELYLNVRLQLPSLNGFLTDIEDGLFPI